MADLRQPEEAKKAKISPISAKGRRDTKLVAAARLVAALFVVITLVSMADLIGNHIAAGTSHPLSARHLVLPISTAVLAGVFAFGEVLYGGVAARTEEKEVRRRLLNETFTSPSLPDNTDPEGDASQLITLMTDNAERLTEYRQVYLGATLAAISIPLLTGAYIAVAFNVLIGVSLMVLFALIPILIGLFMAIFRKTSANSRKERAILSGKYLDAIRNLVLIRLMGAGPRVEQQLREAGEKNRGAIMKLLAGNQMVIIVLDGLFSLLMIFAAAGLSVWQVQAGNLTVTHAIAIMLLTTLLVEPLVQVAGFFYIGMGGMASQRRIRTYLAEVAEAKELAASPAPAPGEESGADTATWFGGAPSSGGGVVLAGVNHDYGRGPVLTDLDLQVPSGTKAAIIGRSGAGKSTLLSLLRGTLPLQAGDMWLGEHNSTDLSVEELRAQSATVSQRTWMFTGTVADNLRLANPDATEDELWQALETAEIADEVRGMPAGLDTDIGEGGGLISGGQAQRLSLARALLSGRKILLLDEPTSQIDAASEERLIKALGALDDRWTVLMVTHRPSLLSIADRTYVMQDGHVEAQTSVPQAQLAGDAR